MDTDFKNFSKISIYIFVFLDFFVCFAIIGTTSPSLLSLLDGTLHSIAAEKIQQTRVCPSRFLFCWFLLFKKSFQMDHYWMVI